MGIRRDLDWGYVAACILVGFLGLCAIALIGTVTVDLVIDVWSQEILQ